MSERKSGALQKCETKDCIALEDERFQLSLDFQVFAADIPCPSNTILSVFVSSDGFSASAVMDIDIKDVAPFCVNLQKIYASFSGEAKIQEPFGTRQHILFSGDKKGHIFVSGALNSNDEMGQAQICCHESEKLANWSWNNPFSPQYACYLPINTLKPLFSLSKNMGSLTS